MVQRLDPSLTMLSLRQCLRIRKPVLRLTRLDHLSLMGCFALTDLPKFSCPTLKHLNLGFCFRLSTGRIQQAVESLPFLEVLTLIKCTSLEKLVLQSDTLRLLNVNFCSSLHSLKLSCPNLERLDNIACNSLDTLYLDGNNASLLELNLSFLPVTRLEVFASELRQLNLSGCRRLDHCIIHCPNLVKVNYRGSRIVALQFCKEVREVIIKNWAGVSTPLQLQ
jgi:hypothetical protein